MTPESRAASPFTIHCLTPPRAFTIHCLRPDPTPDIHDSLPDTGPPISVKASDRTEVGRLPGVGSCPTKSVEVLLTQ